MYRDWYIQKNTAQVQEYGVEQFSFADALRARATIVKMDIEGSEIPILQQKWNWKHTRLLMVEISVVNLRKEFGQNSWQKFADILDNIKNAKNGGFWLAKIEKRFWTMDYWTPETTERNLLSDGILWFLRPTDQRERDILTKVIQDKDPDPESLQCTAWRHYRGVMEGGGLTQAINLEQAVKAARVTWQHFARHKSIQKSERAGHGITVTSTTTNCTSTVLFAGLTSGFFDYDPVIREVCCRKSNRVD